MNTAHHDWQDSVSDWAMSHPITRRAYIPQGCTQQGRHEATIEPKPPVDRVREEFDEDQSESADAEVVIWLLKGLGVLLGVMFCVWVIVRYGHAF